MYNPSIHKITLLEASKIAGGASGKAGGLLGLWAYPSSIVPLSYRLHAELAKEHNGAERWGYRQIHCGQLEARGRPLKTSSKNDFGKNDEHISLQKRDAKAIAKLKAAGIPPDLDWVSADTNPSYESMGDPSTTAQVHPYQFTTSMAELAQEKGVKIELGSVVSINKDSGGVNSVTYTSKETGDSTTIPANTIVLSAGPWTRSIHPPAPISALRAHSVTIKPSRPVSAYALFTEISLPSDFKLGKRRGQTVAPEIYARPNNEIYACGDGDTLVPLPSTSADVGTDLQRCQDIVDYVGSISDELRDGEVTVRQACYLPQVEGRFRGPLIGQSGINGLIIAAGHTCWGIQNGPGTGKLVSEFVFDGTAKSADVRSLDPRKAM